MNEHRSPRSQSHIRSLNTRSPRLRHRNHHHLRTMECLLCTCCCRCRDSGAEGEMGMQRSECHNRCSLFRMRNSRIRSPDHHHRTRRRNSKGTNRRTGRGGQGAMATGRRMY
eukprot:scaffold3540_cov147-Isochrysis_galbana.AAC.5